MTACLLGLTSGVRGQMVTGTGMADFAAVFDLPAREPGYRAVLIESSAPGNVFLPGERPRLTFQLQNSTDRSLRAEGFVAVLAYGTRGIPGDIWRPRVFKIADLEGLPLSVSLEPGGWQNVTVTPAIPERLGAYALVVDLGSHGRRFLTGLVRTFAPEPGRTAWPKQSLEAMPPAILERLGVQAIRYGVPFYLTGTRQRRDLSERLEREFAALHAHRVTAVVEIGTGHQGQPLGRGRPHLDPNDRMQGGKEDLVWLPEHDEDYEAFVFDLACRYGWPRGPVTGVMLWNEPWEGMSISGWGADMIRYRTLYERMARAVERARRDAAVDVLVGGCDSSTNTWDKLFPDGSDRFLRALDFCSIHYQGLAAPALYPSWHDRTDHHGRVLIWDTESWVANTDDRFAAVVAANRAAGYDRAMGIYGGNVTTVLSHHRVAYDTIQTEAGPRRSERLLMSWPPAAAVAASQHFIGERGFREILDPNGLPWIFVFDGLPGRAEDGTVVVVGDLEALFNKGGALYRNVRPLAELRGKEALTRELASLPPVQTELRRRLRERLDRPWPFTGVRLILPADPNRYGLFDFYGNAVPAVDGRIVIPVDNRGFFLRARAAQAGSFDALLAALRQGRVEGLEPLEIVAHDLLRPLGRTPRLRLELANVIRRPVTGRLHVTLGSLQVTAPAQVSLAAGERRVLELPVRGVAVPSNDYPLSVDFDAGADGRARHREVLHVNWICRRTVTVDGDLSDWEGVLPLTLRSDETAQRSLQEAAWLPFVAFAAGGQGGLATAYLAYDADRLYVAVKAADDSPHPGTLRFATRNADADFYPAEVTDPAGRTLRWPAGVRRFSYRRWPELPFSNPSRPCDNVLIAFNAIPDEQDAWLTHLPGRPPHFTAYKCTDYEFALNQVAPAYGGGTEVWTLQCPGLPRKHFFPRQPVHPLEGPVGQARLAIRHVGGTRVTELGLPWSAIPEVRACRDAGRTVKFSFRVNNDRGGPTLELARGRSVSKINNQAFHPDWQEHWANEVAFAFEPTE